MSIDALEPVHDGLAHHVHADAAAGDVADRRGGREAGAEDELEDVAVVHRVGLVRR